MAINQILLLGISALVLGRLGRGKGRICWPLAASVFFVFWMQPPLPLRGLSFLLPLFALGLVVLAWAATASPAGLRSAENRRAAGLLLVLVSVLAASRYFGPKNLLPAPPPALGQTLGTLAFLALAGVALAYVAKKRPSVATWSVFGLLLTLFLILKTPALSQAVSRFWRLWHYQNPALASALDIRWLGYSYLAFRLLHTLRDRQSGRLPEANLGEYLTYVIFFPALAAGPIDRIERFLKDLRAPASDFTTGVLEGGQRLAVGLFKKFVVADTLAMIALNPISAHQARSAWGAWVLLYAYAFQIYFDFSGYTDIAIGLGQWMGIRLPENFRQPYRQPNLTMFWNNWHITLTQWFRSYFFNPFVRSLRRRKRLSTGGVLLVSQLATMGLIGLWHGVESHFLLWGIWHGLGLFIQNRWSSFWRPRLGNLSGGKQRALHVGSVLLTFHFVALGWVWFVLPTASAWHFLLKLGGIFP